MVTRKGDEIAQFKHKGTRKKNCNKKGDATL